jgi:glycosyltransferase involved in cell wall biosynthesis
MGIAMSSGSAVPEISVIITAWNSGRWIAETLRTVFQQSFQNFEVIVVDDGSTDDTSRIVAGFSDPRLRYARQENRGQSVASNVGAAMARGRFLKFLDADDLWNVQHLAAQHQAICDCPGAIASCTWGYFRENSDATQPRSEHVNRDFDDPLEWLVTSLTQDEGMMGVWMWLIPREVWQLHGGFSEELTLNKDFDLSIRLLLGSRCVKFAGGALYCYRKGIAEAVTQNRGPRSLASALRTTQLGAASLLAREDSPRIRRICANRFQMWLFSFYPEYPDLVHEAERQIQALGGSDLRLQGGLFLRLLSPLFGWKGVRRLQVFARSLGWVHIQKWTRVRQLRRVK